MKMETVPLEHRCTATCNDGTVANGAPCLLEIGHRGDHATYGIGMGDSISGVIQDGSKPHFWRRVEVTTVENKQNRFEAIVIQCMQEILGSMEREFGLDARGPNFIDTPQRVARAYSEIFSGLMADGKQVKEILSKTFPAKSEEMITVGPIQVWSVCAHHFLPFSMDVWVAYIPKKKVLGLSKLARLTELVAKKPSMQEEVTDEIATTLQEGLKPKGSACIIRGRHLCMAMRGIKKDSVMTTTALKGVFLEPAVRAEFLDSVRKDGRF